MNKPMNKITTINRAIATLIKLLSIKRRNKDVDINKAASSQYMILKVAFDLYSDVYSNSITTISFNNMIDEAKLFIQKTREKSHAK